MLAWVGSCRGGLGEIELGWVGLGWVGLGWDGFGWFGSGWRAWKDLRTHARTQARAPTAMPVRVEGPLVSLDMEASVQWLQCSVCPSEDLQETDQGWRCQSCQSEENPRRMLELVCDVGERGARVRLTNQAHAILAHPAGSDVGGFNPADVIGQIVPSTLCVVGTDCVARDC